MCISVVISYFYASNRPQLSGPPCGLASLLHCRVVFGQTERIMRHGDPYVTRTRVFAVRGRRPGPLDEGAAQPINDGDPYGTRTRVSAVKGPRPRPLDEGAVDR